MRRGGARPREESHVEVRAEKGAGDWAELEVIGGNYPLGLFNEQLLEDVHPFISLIDE